MGVVTGDATQAPSALEIAGRLGEADRLKSGQGRVLGTDHVGRSPGRMAVTLATKFHLGLGRPVPGPERHPEISETSASVLDVLP